MTDHTNEDYDEAHPETPPEDGEQSPDQYEHEGMADEDEETSEATDQPEPDETA